MILGRCHLIAEHGASSWIREPDMHCIFFVLRRYLFEFLSVSIEILAEVDLDGPVGLLFFVVASRHILMLTNLLTLVVLSIINWHRVACSTDRISCGGILVDGVSVRCPTFMFLGKITDNFDVSTSMMQKGCFSWVSIIPLATRLWFSSVL